MPPQFTVDEISAICNLGPRPQIVTGYLRQWLAIHFSRQATIEHPELRSLLWQALDTPREDGQDPILIESLTRWRPTLTETRPAVIIRRNDWNTRRRGIADKHMGFLTPDGVQHFASEIEGSHTCFCLSTRGPEAEILASEVYREFMQFGEQMRRELDLMRFVTVGVGRAFRVREARQNLAVPVTVAYVVEEAWAVVPHKPFLKKIDLDLLLP
jgi:hypothetical protein